MLWRDLLTIRSVKLPTEKKGQVPCLPRGAFFLKEGATRSAWAICDTPEEVAESEHRYTKLVTVWDSTITAVGQAP